MYQDLIFNHFSKNLSALRIPEPAPDFYSSTVKRMLPLFGSHEHQANDYLNALRYLNKQFSLGLDSFDCEVFNLMLTKLSQSQRFKNEFHLEPWLGEHTAIHTGHCVIFGTDYVRKAKLLTAENQTDEIIALRLGLSWGLLLHDMGEILREWSSLGQRVAQASLREIPEIEHMVFESALHAAIFAVQQGVETEAADFYRSISDLSRRVKNIALDDAGIHTVREVITQFEKETISRLTLTPQSLAKKERFVAFYDLVELKDSLNQDSSDRFLAYAVKVIEHTQGSRYLIRACTKDKTLERWRAFRSPTSKSEWEEDITERLQIEGRRSVPLSLSPSARVFEELGYLEQGIGEMFEAATTKTEVALAEEIRNGAYETRVEWLSLGPAYIDRFVRLAKRNEKPKIDGEILKLFAKVWSRDLSRDDRDRHLAEVEALLHQEQSQLARRHKELIREIGDQNVASLLLEVESRERLIKLYLAAKRANYIPKPGDPPLARISELPETLSPLPDIDWRKEDGGELLAA